MPLPDQNRTPIFASEESGPPPRWVFALWLLGLTLTTLLTLALHNYQGERLQARFANEVLRVSDDIERRFKLPVYGLMGARGVYAASSEVARGEFLKYVESRDIDGEFPGVRGMGFIERVPRTELDAFVERERSDGAPDFKIRSLAQTEQPDLYVIKYIEPQARNRNALGLDIGSEAVRREGAERAARNGQPALTGVIQLAQDQLSRPGFLLYVPVYRPGLPLDTPEQRLAALRGMTYSPIVLQELLQPSEPLLLGTDLHISIVDQTTGEASEPLFSIGKANESAWLRAERPLVTGSSGLVLQAHTTPAFEATANRWLVYGVGLSGLVLSSLLAWALWLQATGRTRAEARAQRLTVDLQKLALVAQRTANSVLMTDALMRISWVNEGFTRITGYSMEEAAGKTPAELLASGKANPAALETLRQAAEEGGFCRVEILNRTKDGREYWVDTEVQPTHDETGRLTGFIEIGLDITRERETNQRLVQAVLESEAQKQELDLLARVARETTNAVLLTDTHGRIEWVNEGFTRISGYTLQESLGEKPGHLLQCPQTDPQTVARLRSAISALRPCKAEILNRAKDGRLYWLEIEIQPLFDATGRHTGFMAIESDVTGRLETLDSLQRALLERQSLMTAINQGAIYSVADLQGNITEINDEFVKMSGYRREELIGANHRILNSGVHPTSFWENVWATISSGNVWRGEVCNRAKNGSPYWVVASIVPFVGVDGLVEKYISIRTDVTANKAAQVEIESQKKRLNNILQGTNVGTWEWHVPTGRTIFNERWAGIVGHTLAELEPVSIETWMRFAHPDDLQRSSAALQRHFSGELDHYEVEIRMRHKDGHWVWVLDRGRVASREPDGSPGWMFGTHQDITQRKQSEISLRLGEARMKALTDLSAQWIWETDTDHRFTRFSCGDPEMLAELNREGLGRRRWEIGVEPLTSTWTTHQAQLERRERFLRFQDWRIDDRGLVRYWQTSGSPWYDEDGAFVGYIGIGSDISESKRADVRLARSEALLERTGQIAKVGAWRVDLKTGQPEWSAETCRIHDLPVDYQPKMDEALAFYAPEARPVITEAVNKGLTRGESWDLELPFITATGRRIWVRALGEVEVLNGQPVALVGAFQDITERREQQDRLRAQEARLRAIYDILPVGVSITDQQGFIIDCNPASERLLGVTKAEHLARRHDDRGWRINREDGSPMPTEEFASVRALTRGEAVTDSIMQVVTEHHSVWLSVSAMPVRHENFGAVIVYVDISDQKAQSDALLAAKTVAEQASAFKSQFLANMSHEIRTPMNAILGMLQLLHHTGLQPRQLDYVKKTEGAAKSLLGLLNDILDFSKVEAGKMTLDIQPFGLDRLLRDLSVIFSASVGSKPVEVLFDIDPRVPRELLGDSLRLQQILINLGGNAIKFTARGEVVLRVRLEVLENEGPEPCAKVHFAVQDSGIGIAPENQQRVFTDFTQAEAATTRRFGGSGLGLSICRRLVELMGGELKLKSTLGQGSTFSFTVRLPMLDAKPQALAWPAPGPASADGRVRGARLTVLVVDDNPMARELMYSMGQSLGWAVDTADSGEAALALIDQRARRGLPYRAVFMDWLMPGLDGWQTSARIRSLPPATGQTVGSPVIMMVTAHGSAMLAQQTDEVQNLIDGYLVKPVTASMLFDAMQTAVPLAGATDPASGTCTPSEVQRPLAGLRLLLVEDNAINQEVAETLLSVQGAAVDIAENGLRGVEAVQAALTAGKPYHAVLMDMQMPVMDGLTATREIRGLVNATTLPIIAMTANAMASDREACLAAGMNDHVGKPFDLDRLVATLLDWTKGQRRVAAGHRKYAPPSHTAAGPFPAVAGIETEVAALRLNQDADLFVRLLGLMAADFTDLLQLQTPADVTARLATPDTRQHLGGRIHKLRGSAGAVGAQTVLSNASAAERAIAAQTDDAVPRLLALVASLGELVQGIQTLLAAQAAAGSPVAAGAVGGAPVDPAALASLIGLLGAQDFAAVGLYAELKTALGAALGAEAAGELNRAMQALDFARALKLLQG